MSYLHPKDDNVDKGRRKRKSTSVHAMKECGEVELWFILKRRNRWGGGSFASYNVCFTPGEKALRTHRIAGWIGSRDGLDSKRRQNSDCSPRNRTPDRVSHSLFTTTTTSPPLQKMKIQEKQICIPTIYGCVKPCALPQWRT